MAPEDPTERMNCHSAYRALPVFRVCVKTLPGYATACHTLPAHEHAHNDARFVETRSKAIAETTRAPF